MESEQPTNIGDFLKKIRKIKKLKQGDVSRKMGVLPSTICRYEGNQTRPSLEKVNDLVEAYQLTAGEEKEFREMLILRDLRFQRTPRELQLLTQLLALSKSIRKQIIQAAIAYDAANENGNGR